MSPEPEPIAKALVPPRPNLGPEPWPTSGGRTPWPWIAGFAASAVIAAVVARSIRKRTRTPAAQPESRSTGEPQTDRETMIFWDRAVRRALVERFGEGWLARTTEEIETDEDLRSRWNGDFERLVAFLRAADRWKFAGANQDPVADWTDWIEAFLRGESGPNDPAGRPGARGVSGYRPSETGRRPSRRGRARS